MRTHTLERPYECVVCKKSFYDSKNFHKHKKLHTRGSNGELVHCDVSKRVLPLPPASNQCSTCGKCFGKAHELRVHQASWESKPFRCGICCRRFPSQYYLHRHVPVHAGGSRLSLDCVMCHISPSSLSALENHLRLHTLENPYVCKVKDCGKSFSDSKNFRKHQMIHSGEKRYQCHICPKGFIKRSTLTDHIRARHTNEKPFQCDHCGKCFSQKGVLIAHERIHTNEKPFKCDVCSKQFTFGSTLAKHMYTHRSENEPRVKCKFCDKHFGSPPSYLNHLRKKHKGEVEVRQNQEVVECESARDKCFSVHN